MSKINSNLIQEDLNNLHSIITNEIDSKVEDVYSTSEVKTNKVWIDDKPIYRKIVPITDNGTYNESGKRFTWTNSNINNLSQVTDLFCVINYSNRALTSSSNEVDIYYLTDKRLQFAVSTNYTAGSSGYVIIEYTKTTD